jgi:hypothetical protein
MFKKTGMSGKNHAKTGKGVHLPKKAANKGRKGKGPAKAKRMMKHR